MRLARAFAIIGIVIAPVTGPVTAASPDVIVRQFLDQAVPLASTDTVPEPERYRRFDSLIRQFFDTARFGHDLAGGLWAAAPPRQRRALARAVTGRVVMVYMDLLRIRPGQSVRVDARLEGGDPEIVHSRIVSGGGEADVRIEWSVEQRGGTPRIVDARFDGESVGAGQRQEYAAILRGRGGGAGSLIEWLDEQMSLRLKAEC